MTTNTPTNKTATVWMLPTAISTPCQTAMVLLTNHKYTITTKDIRVPANKTEFTASMPDAKVVPQIWIDGTHIGGVDELKAFLNV